MRGCGPAAGASSPGGPTHGSRSGLECPAVEGDSPVGETVGARAAGQSTTAWYCRGKLGGTDFQG